MLQETAVKTWWCGFSLIIAVKHFGGFVITGKSVFYFKTSGKVKSDQSWWFVAMRFPPGSAHSIVSCNHHECKKKN